MADFNDDTDPITAALSTRRIPHGRSRNQRSGKGNSKGKGSGGGSTIFDPIRSLGHYEVQLGSKNSKRGQQAAEHEPGHLSSWLELHELTEREDGLLGTLNLVHRGQISAICVLAGSRKGLQEIVDALEHDDDNEEDDGDKSEDRDEDNEDGRQDADESNEDAENSHSDNDQQHQHQHQSALEAADEKLNRRIRAFEKNSFRNPKFWIRWKGHVHGHGQDTGERHPAAPTSTTTENLSTSGNGDDGGSAVENTTSPQSTVETNTGYMIFSNNACERFEGTISCSELGWENLKIQGWKTRSRASACPVSWRDVV